MEHLAHTATVNGVQFVNERRMKMDEVKDYPPYLDYPKPCKAQTNADRIRSMSDEELADFIDRCEMNDIDYAKTFCDLCNGQYECDQCRLDWLKQPAE